MDREEAAAETGDGSQRHRQRVQTSDTSRTESGSRESSGSSRGSTSTIYSSKTNTEGESSGSGGGGIRIESGSYGGRGSQGTLITERGRVEVSGARVNSGGGNFETYSSFDNDRRVGGGYGVSQSGRAGGSNIESSVGGGASRGRVASEERGYSIDHNRGSTQTQYGGNRGGESSSRRNQTYWYEEGAGGIIPLNVSGIQNRTFTHEEERSSNTTWNSETGGRPITHTSSSWRENENGVVRSGSSSNSQEGGNINIGDLNVGGSYSSGRSRTEPGRGYATESSVSRQYGSESERRYRTESVSGSGYRGSGNENDRSQGSSSSTSEQGLRRYESGSRGSSGATDYSSRRTQGAASSSSGTLGSSSGSTGYDSRRTYNGASSSSGSLGSSSDSSSGSNGYDSRRTYNGVSGSSGSSSGSSSSGSAGYDSRTYNSNSGGSGSSQFDALAGIAQGPRDGVARVYSFDVNSENNRRTSGGASQYGSVAGMAAGGRAHTVNADGSRVHVGSGDQYANSSSSSRRNSWSSTSGGGKHYVSGATNSEEGDNVDYDVARDKDQRFSAGRDNVDYDTGDRRGGSSWSSSSSWEAKSSNYGGYPEQSSRKTRTQSSQSAARDNVVEEDEPGVRNRIVLLFISL